MREKFLKVSILVPTLIAGVLLTACGAATSSPAPTTTPNPTPLLISQTSNNQVFEISKGQLVRSDIPGIHSTNSKVLATTPDPEPQKYPKNNFWNAVDVGVTNLAGEIRPSCVPGHACAQYILRFQVTIIVSTHALTIDKEVNNTAIYSRTPTMVKVNALFVLNLYSESYMSYPHSSDSSIVAPVQDEVLPADNQYNISFFKALKPGEVTIYVPDNQACADSFKNCGNLQISFKVIVQG